MSAKCYPPMYSALRREKRRATALPTEWTINEIQWKIPKGTILTRHTLFFNVFSCEKLPENV
jgi:hypothetical protein